METTTFIDEVEQVVDEVAIWGADQVKAAIDALAPDGRPFGTVKRTEEEQIAEYLTIRGNPTNWLIWLRAKSEELIQQLMVGGIDQDVIATIDPVDIAIAFAIDYSAEMESKLVDNG